MPPPYIALIAYEECTVHIMLVILYSQSLKQKLRRIKSPEKISLEAYLYPPPEWS